jgi:hypothetical protein
LVSCKCYWGRCHARVACSGFALTALCDAALEHLPPQRGGPRQVGALTPGDCAGALHALAAARGAQQQRRGKGGPSAAERAHRQQLEGVAAATNCHPDRCAAPAHAHSHAPQDKPPGP